MENSIYFQGMKRSDWLISYSQIYMHDIAKTDVLMFDR